MLLAAAGLSCGMGDLVPRPEAEPRPPALVVRSFSHWTCQGSPSSDLLMFINSSCRGALLPAWSRLPEYTLSSRTTLNWSATSYSSPAPQTKGGCFILKQSRRRKRKVEKITLRKRGHRPTLMHISPQECTAQIGNEFGLMWSPTCSALKRQSEGRQYTYFKPQGITKNVLRAITSETVKR